MLSACNDINQREGRQTTLYTVYTHTASVLPFNNVR